MVQATLIIGLKILLGGHMSLAREWNMMFVNRRRHLSALDISQCPFVVYESRSKCWFTWFAYQHNTSRSKFNAFVVLTQRGWSWCQLISAYCEFSKLELLERGAEFDLVVPLLTSLVKFESWFKSSTRMCKQQISLQLWPTIVAPSWSGLVCRLDRSISAPLFAFRFWISSEQFCTMKGRRPSTRSTSSRTGLVDSPGRKMFSEVLLVCELLLFITLTALTGGNPPSTSTRSQKKRPQVRKPTYFF